jgi:biotin carboxyl carrier protein
MKYKIAVGKKKFEVEVGEVMDGLAQVTVGDETYEVSIENYADVIGAGQIRLPNKVQPPPRAQTPQAAAPRPSPTTQPAVATPPAGEGAVTAPITGQIIDIKVDIGQKVSAGQVVATIEAMKMENELMCAVSGKVLEIRVQPGDQIAAGDVILFIG